MIQTMTSGRSDLFDSSPHLLPFPPLPPTIHRDAYPPHPSSASSSSERSHYAILGGLSYSQNKQRSLDTEFKSRDSSSLQKLRQKDHSEDKNGPETLKVMHFSEHVDVSPKERDALHEPGSICRNVSNSVGYQRQQSRTPQQQRHEALWVRTGSDLGVTNRYDDNVEEDDVDFVSPPKIAPISGQIPAVSELDFQSSYALELYFINFY